MVTSPIHVRWSSYRGRDPRKLQKAREENERASRIEVYINKRLETQTAAVEQYLYYEIAADTGYTFDEVRDACFSIDCGDNGFTAIRPGLTFEKAMQDQRSQT